MVRDRRILVANSLYHLANDGGVTVMAGQITVLQATFAFGAFETGLLSGLALLVAAIFQFVFGVMSDRRDPSRFLPIGIAILGLGSLLVATATTFLTLLAFVALSRVGASFYHPVGIAWIGREFAGESLDRSMGFQSAFGDSGVILGMASGAVLAVAFGWASPFLLWGGINLLAVAVGLWLVRGRPSPPPAHADPPDYRGMLRKVRLWLFPLALGGAAFNVFSTFGPPLLHHRFGLADDVSGVAIALWILAGALAAFFFGRLSRRFGRFRTLAASYAGVAAAGFVGAFAGHPALVLAGLWTVGSALFLTYPALFSFVSEASHARLQGAAFGLLFAFQILGGAIGVFAAGAIAVALAPDPASQAGIPFALIGLLVLAGFGYMVALRRRLDSRPSGVPVAAPPL